MITLQTDRKGKLELLLDDFTDVHGTVLLGMHKELQTLKQEIDVRVETRISIVLDQIKSADSTLHTQIEEAEIVLSKLEQGRFEFQQVLEKVDRQRSEFQQEITQALKNLAIAQQAHQTKMSAALRVADKLNSDGLASLKAVGERSAQLHLREVVLQKRTRMATTGVGIAIFATVGVWIWLTLSH